MVGLQASMIPFILYSRIGLESIGTKMSFRLLL